MLHASIASVRDSDLLNVRFGPLCGPRSEKCPGTDAVQQRLFDHLVGAREQHERDGDTNRFGLALRKETGP
jgi:hypothetical protein